MYLTQESCCYLKYTVIGQRMIRKFKNQADELIDVFLNAKCEMCSRF